MYLTRNEGRCVVAERFIRAVKNRIYKYIALVSKNVYIDKLVDIVNKCRNIYHSKMNLLIKSQAHILIFIKITIRKILK